MLNFDEMTIEEIANYVRSLTATELVALARSEDIRYKPIVKAECLTECMLRLLENSHAHAPL